MKKLLAIIFAAVLCFALGVAAVADDTPTVNGNWIDSANTDWYNTTDTQFTITTPQQLAGLAAIANGTAANIAKDTFSGKKITLGANIDLAGKNWTPIGVYSDTGANQKPFAGVFDGDNHTISNMTFSGELADMGLFGMLNGNKICNLTIENAVISGTATHVGTLIAYNNKALIDNVTVVGTNINVTASYVGGMSGFDHRTQINNSTVKNITINVNGNSYVGGMVGYSRAWVGEGAYTYCIDGSNYTVDGKTYTKVCFFKASKVEGTNKITVNANAVEVGGFVGYAGDSWRNSCAYFENCSATAAITCNGNGTYLAGGFVGQAYAGKQYTFFGDDPQYKNCNAYGTITANATNTASYYGGFAGQLISRTKNLIGCTTAVNVNVANGTVGGFAGYVAFANENNSHSFTNCAATGAVATGEGIAGGFIGVIDSNYASNGSSLTITNCTSATSVSGTSKTDVAYVKAPYYLKWDENSAKWILDSTANAVAKATVNGVDIGFATIQEAVDTGAETVTLLRNATENFTLYRTAGSNFTLELGTFILTGEITVPSDITLTVTGTGSKDNITVTDSKGEKVFKGWNANQAEWVDSKITYNANNGTNAENVQYANLGENLQQNGFNYTGHTFAGWCMEDGTLYTETTVTDKLRGEHTLYAVWSVEIGGVTYTVNPVAPAKTYTGKPLQPYVTVTKNSEDYRGYRLVYDADEMTNVGTKTIDVYIGEQKIGTARFTIEPAKLTANYVSENITIGEEPKLVITVTGFVNGENESVLTKKPSIDGTVPTEVGEHKLTLSGGEADNYEFEYVSGTLTIKEKEEETKPDPKPESKPEPCDHSFDANGKCKYCGIIVIDHTTEKSDDELNPNTGAESAIGVAAAVAALSLAGIEVSKKK